MKTMLSMLVVAAALAASTAVAQCPAQCPSKGCGQKKAAAKCESCGCTAQAKKADCKCEKCACCKPAPAPAAKTAEVPAK